MATTMSAREPALNAADASRLSECLAAISDTTSESRWSALEQLRYFCDGADAALLEAIGGRRFNTLVVLAGLLEQVEELGGPMRVRSAPTRARVPVGLVLQLLETLLCTATNNLKPFLRQTAGPRLLVRALAHVDELVADPEGLEILDRACNILCYLTCAHRPRHHRQPPRRTGDNARALCPPPPETQRVRRAGTTMRTPRQRSRLPTASLSSAASRKRRTATTRARSRGRARRCPTARRLRGRRRRGTRSRGTSPSSSLTCRRAGCAHAAARRDARHGRLARGHGAQQARGVPTGGQRDGVHV